MIVCWQVSGCVPETISCTNTLQDQFIARGGDLFGSSVAIVDGTKIFVGAPYAGGDLWPGPGAVFIFGIVDQKYYSESFVLPDAFSYQEIRTPRG